MFIFAELGFVYWASRLDPGLIMGFGTNDDDDVVLVDDDGGGGGGGRSDCTSGGKQMGFVSCSICLETVTDNGDRSWAKLQCGHQFHLGESSSELKHESVWFTLVCVEFDEIWSFP